MPEQTGAEYRTILGIRFFQGSAADAVDRMGQGGLLVVPAAPALKDLATDPGYRDALVHADLALADSAFMVLAWPFQPSHTLPAFIYNNCIQMTNVIFAHVGLYFQRKSKARSL